MDYTEQFIRLNCSLMSDYKMMKLNAEMKCMGIGLYIQMILFLRRQQEYKHDFNELVRHNGGRIFPMPVSG